MLRSLDRALDYVGAFGRSLNAGDLIASAQKRTGLDDFGQWNFREPLEVLLHAYENESALTTFGRLAARWDMSRMLTNLLRLRREEAEHPEILRESITQPIFILGMPRSGTTFLHNLLILDPNLRIPLCWQTILPYPLSDDPDTPDRRERVVRRQLAGFLRLAPHLPELHPLAANGAQECIEITGQVFQSMRYDTTHYVPSYEQWLDRAGHLEAYRFHRRFLQHLQHQDRPRRWVLKSPDHIFAFSALEKVYPDARFIFVHREPLRVLASVAKLTEILRWPFTRRVDRDQIGRQVMRRWRQGADALVAVSDRYRHSDRLLHLRHDDLIGDPIGTVKHIYRHFGMVLEEATARRFQQAIARRPNWGYGRNHYRLDEFGLEASEVKRAFEAYADYFGLASEAVNEPPARVRVGVVAPAPELS
jgi:hypothetical protein